MIIVVGRLIDVLSQRLRKLSAAREAPEFAPAPSAHLETRREPFLTANWRWLAPGTAGLPSDYPAGSSWLALAVNHHITLRRALPTGAQARVLRRRGKGTQVPGDADDHGRRQRLHRSPALGRGHQIRRPDSGRASASQRRQETTTPRGSAGRARCWNPIPITSASNGRPDPPIATPNATVGCHDYSGRFRHFW